jgi:hypothetical protein
MLPVRLPTEKPKRYPVELPSPTRALGLSGTAQTDAVVDVYVHSHHGQDNGAHVFMRGNCRTDFADVWFEDELGNRLDYYQVSAGNWSVEPDLKLGLAGTSTRYHICAVTAGGVKAGDIIATRLNAAGATNVMLSSDNGQTWTTIYAQSADVLGTDDAGNVYVSRTGAGVSGLYRGVYAAETWTFTLAISIIKADTSIDVNGGIQPYGWSNFGGRLLAGRYGSTDQAIEVYVSDDNGATWTEIYTDAANANALRPVGGVTTGHVHGLALDNDGNVFVGVNATAAGDNQLLYAESWAESPTWTILQDDISSAYTAMTFDATHGLFGGDPDGMRDGRCVYRLKLSDTSWTSSLAYFGTCQNLWQVGGIYFASTQPYRGNRQPIILASTDAGVSWQTIWTGAYDATDFTGPSWVSNTGTPTGSDSQAILGYNKSATVVYEPMRVFGGGNRYQALYRVKLSSLGAQGHTIYACCDGQTRTSGSVVTAARSGSVVDAIYASGLVARWTFDASNGADSSGNGFTLTAKGTGHSYTDPGARVGPAHPGIVQTGKSLTLAKTGYMRSAELADADALDLVENFTMIGWVKLRPSLDGQTQYFFGRGDMSTKAQYVLRCSNSATPRLGLLTNNVTRDSADTYWTPCSGVWQQVGVVVLTAASKQVKFIINGYLSAAATMTNAIAGTDHYYFAIGNAPKADDTVDIRFAPGGYDDVAVWNRVLTDAEILALYEARAPQPTVTARG